ncbi:MAG: DUF4976 domain-containing protein [Verrucomicrobia bacterium]|nr:DUF4976 domain-containing protein [Verrucomicrobiota bacterium]
MNVIVHNVGTQPAKDILVRVTDNHSGRMVDEATIKLLDAPLDLKPRTATLEFHNIDYISYGSLTVELDTGTDAGGREVFSENHTEGLYATCFMLRKGKYKYIYIHGEAPQLFDLEKDPEEWNNLIGTTGHQQMEKELRERILQKFDVDAIEKDVQSSLLKRQLIRQSMQRTGINWDHSPAFDAGKDALEQYLAMPLSS